MLPLAVINACIGIGLVLTAAVIATDAKQRAGMRNLVMGHDKLAVFQRLYLPVFLTAMLADWLQGPFVYALYEGYGIDRAHNGYLFVAGFGSSALFGTYVGAAADRCGRKKFALLYCVTYLAHCATKHVNSFLVLTVGRILGGISTSLLFSVFDSWLVSESLRRGFHGEQLGDTFSLAYFGSNVVAIVAGQVGEVAANYRPLTQIGAGVHYGGYVTPFDLANGVLVVCMAVIARSWPENYGASKAGGTDFGEAFKLVLENRQVLLCGLIASSFESSMFIFVFNWTPCLMEEGVPPPPFGHLFSCFMILCMLGSRIFSVLSGVMSVDQIGLITMAASAMSHVVIVLSTDVTIRFFAFLVFEMCVGLYFPMIGTLKGDIVPEDMRSTIYNIYRLPLNVAVLLPLMLNFSIQTTFIVTTAVLVNALLGQYFLMKSREPVEAMEDQEKAEAKNHGLPEDIEAIVFGNPDRSLE